MKITLNYVGYLKFPDITSGSTVEVTEGITIADLMTDYGISRTQQRFLTTFVNEEPAELTARLAEADELTVIIQVGGG